MRAALAAPLDSPPLADLARGARRVTVAFDDPTVPCWAPIWLAAIGAVIAELERAGVPRRGVTLLCANALHRKFTDGELAAILGDELVAAFAPEGRLLCHDAEDPDGLTRLGATAASEEAARSSSEPGIGHQEVRFDPAGHGTASFRVPAMSEIRAPALSMYDTRRNPMQRRNVLFVGLFLLGTSGCVSVTGPKAIRPGPASIGGPFVEVDTLSPLLEWEPGSEGDARASETSVSAESAPETPIAQAPVGEGPICYDVAIHEAMNQPATWTEARRRWVGARVYYRQGIAATSHRVEASLEPGRDYYWFVRTRRGDRVGPWSRYGYFLFFGVAWISGSNLPFRFRTPQAAPAAMPAQGGTAEGTGVDAADSASGGRSSVHE